MPTTKPQRNSTIEILRILAMVLIVFGHQIDAYHYGGIDFAGVAPTTNPQFLLLSFVGPLGLMGDVIFIACSAYFLIDSNRISVKKIIYLVVTDTLVMVGALLVKVALGSPISSREILEAVFPTVLQVNWFVGYYIVFYLLHPLFNYVIRKLDKKGLAIVTAILVIQCNVIAFGMGDAPGQLGLKFLCFMSIYFAVAFYKLYGGKVWTSKKFNVILLTASVLLYIAFRIVINYVGLRSDYVAARQYGYAHISNPIIVVISIAMINLASRLEWHNNVVNYLSGMSLLLYLMHKNAQIFIRAPYFSYLDYFVDTYGAQTFVAAVFTQSLIVLGLGLALSVFYRHTFYYGVMWLGEKAENATQRVLEKLKARQR